MNTIGATIVGVSAYEVKITVKATDGDPSFDVTGLPEQSVRETRVRVRSAIRESHLPFPDQHVIVNLAPADLLKDGTMYDLPVALGILAAQGTIPPGALDGWVVLGELSLSGEIRPVRGVLAVAEMARSQGYRGVICSALDAAAVAVVPGLEVCVARRLDDLVVALQSGRWPAVHAAVTLHEPYDRRPCWSDVRGQPKAQRALEVAAAGAHNVLLSGTPGTGKTMLARRLPTILPPMSDAEAMTVSKVHSVVGLMPRDVGLMRERPFRAPHHTGSAVSLLGGGAALRPGEISLAHGGVLFLDDFPEFPRAVIESLHPPMDKGEVVITRNRQTVRFPGRAMIVAAMNPCPCGWGESHLHPCSCNPGAIDRYRSRLVGSFLDRIDIQVDMSPLPPRMLRDAPAGDTSELVQARVVQARAIQAERFAGLKDVWNATVPFEELQRRAPLAPDTERGARAVASMFSDHDAAFSRLVRVARSIADLAGNVDVHMDHVREAIGFILDSTPAKKDAL